MYQGDYTGAKADATFGCTIQSGVLLYQKHSIDYCLQVMTHSCLFAR